MTALKPNSFHCQASADDIQRKLISAFGASAVNFIHSTYEGSKSSSLSSFLFELGTKAMSSRASAVFMADANTTTLTTSVNEFAIIQWHQ